MKSPVDSLQRLLRAVADRRQLRQTLRRRIRKLTRSGADLNTRQLAELERLERKYDLQGRWTFSARDVLLPATALLLLVVTALLIPTLFPVELTVSALATELRVETVSDVQVPRTEGLAEFFSTGLTSARNENGEVVRLNSVHLEAGEAGQIVLEPFAVSGSLRWTLRAGEASLAWSPAKKPGSVECPISLAIEGLVESELTSPERRDVRRLALCSDPSRADQRIQVSWRLRDPDMAVDIPPFDIQSLDLQYVYPGAERTEVLSGLVEGELLVANRSIEVIPLGFREQIRLAGVDGQMAGLRTEREGWRLRYHGYARQVLLGPLPGRDLGPTLYQHAAGTEWVRTVMGIVTALGALVTFFLALFWR